LVALRIQCTDVAAVAAFGAAATVAVAVVRAATAAAAAASARWPGACPLLISRELAALGVHAR
jgi:hypothetical protein